MISALVQGDLIADPVARTTAAGTQFATATLRVPAGADAVLVGVTAFSASAAEKLLQLRKGDSLAAAGTLEATVWTGLDGQERRGWRLAANQLMSVYEAGRRRKAASPPGDAGERHEAD